MEELQVIETTEGRQFKPWATKDDVQDPASVTALASEIASGKQAIAEAINAKGGSASATESFSELAEAVEEIPVNVQVEDAANLAFPESIAWNILKEAYAQQRVGYASWIVAEFFKDYDTIPLSGADAFYTCDGDFYTEATTHTWHDESYNKVNRFVVYYFTGENVPFSVTQESICPRSMAVMGKFGSINIASAGRIRQIYNGGEINDISFASTNPWCDEVLLAGVKEHNSGYILNGNANVQMFASDIEVLNGGSVINGSSPVLTTVMFPNLTVINSGICYQGISGSSANRQLREIVLPSLSVINGGCVYRCSSTQYDSTSDYNLKDILCPELIEIKGTGSLIRLVRLSTETTPPSLKSLVLPKLINIEASAALLYGEYNRISIYLQSLILPKLTQGGSRLIVYQTDYATEGLPCLIKIEIGTDYSDNFNLHSWRAQTAIKTDDNSLVDEGETFANNREKFLYNFEHYIVDKLADNSTTGLSFTITLYSAVYNIVSATQSITDKLTAKHWNLASA